MAHRSVPSTDSILRDTTTFYRDVTGQVSAAVLAGSVNVLDYGAKGKKQTSTGSMTASTSVLTGVEAVKFPTGTYVAVDGAGATSTTGSINEDEQTLTVISATGIHTGVHVRVAGAGIDGVDLYSEACVVDGTSIRLDIIASTTVAGAVVDIVEPTGVPAKLLGRVVSVPNSTTLILDRPALTSVSGAVVTTDNSRAFQAAIDSMNAAVTYPANHAARHGKILYIPPGELDVSTGWGTYMCHRTIRITRHMLVTGDVPCGALGTEPTAVLEFSPGLRAGFMLEGATDAKTSGGNSAGATIRNLRLEGGAAFDNPGAPSLFGQPYPSIWKPATAYTKGTVRNPSVGRTNDFARVLICVQAGTSSGVDVNDLEAEPEWNANSFLGRVITDNTCKWLITQSAAIEVRASCQIDSVMCFGWYGNSVLWAAQSPTIANLGTMYNIQSWFCGAGPLVIGQDANQINVWGGNSFGCYGYGLTDQSFLGNSYFGFHTQDNIRGPFNITNGYFLNCYAEGGQGPIVLGSESEWVGGIRGAATMDGFNDAGPNTRGPYWTPNTVFANNTCVYPTVDNGFFYWTQSGGTTGATEPDWPKGRGRRLEGDGTVAWYGGGPLAYHTQSLFQVRGTSTPRNFQRSAGGKIIDFWAGGRRLWDDEFFTVVDNLDGNYLTHAWMWMNESSGAGTHGYSWQRRKDSSGYGGRPFLFLGPRAAHKDFEGQLCFPDGFVVGDRAVSPSHGGTTVRAGRMVGFLDAIPTSGTFVRNDWFHFHNPTAAGWVGAVCVTGGTPGTWKRFGAIEP